MAESTSPVIVWTAVAALVLSLSNAGYALYRAARGPDVRAFPTEDVLLFGYPAGEGQPRDLGALAVFELANTSPDYPEIVVDQSVRVLKDAGPVACLSARGEVKLRNSAAPPPAPVAPTAALPVAAPPGGGPPAATLVSAAPAVAPAVPASAAEQTPRTFEATETHELTGMTIYVLDVSSRAELTAGTLLTRRQLFDQVASRSVVDTCHDITGDKHYTTAQLVNDFRGKSIELRYEAQFSESAGLAVSCNVNLTDRRADLLLTRGWINAACDGAKVTPMPGKGGFGQFLDRVFF